MLLRYYSLFLLAAAYFASAPTAAQTVDWQRFYPLNIGDTWTFEAASGLMFEPIRLTHYQRRTVLRDTVLAGEAYRLVRVDSLSNEPGHPVLGEALCAVRVVEATGLVKWVRVEASDEGRCRVPEVEYELDFRTGIPAEDSLYINSRIHEFEAVERWGVPDSNAPFLRAAADLGLTEWRSIGRWQNAYYHRTLMRLVHAVVGGQEYGRPIDSDAWRAFYPLNEGNIYEYQISYNCRPGGGCVEYLRLDVGAETTIEGIVYQTIRARRFDEEFEGIDEASCTVRIEEDGRVLTGTPEEGCLWVNMLATWMDLRSYTWALTRTEEGLQKSFWYTHEIDVKTVVVEGVGVISRSYVSPHGTGGGSRSRTQLLFALVDGRRYGSPVIPGISGSENGVSAQIEFSEAFPNPFRTAVDLTLSMDVSESVTLEVFDVLGRRVLSRDLSIQPTGPSQHRITLGNTAAGVYVVRATTGSGAQATRRLVRVE